MGSSTSYVCCVCVCCCQPLSTMEWAIEWDRFKKMVYHHQFWNSCTEQRTKESGAKKESNTHIKWIALKRSYSNTDRGNTWSTFSSSIQILSRKKWMGIDSESKLQQQQTSGLVIMENVGLNLKAACENGSFLLAQEKANKWACMESRRRICIRCVRDSPLRKKQTLP